MAVDPLLNKMVAGFTSDGTPLSALIGNKMEWGVVTLAAGMLANEHLASQMSAEELVDSCINYYNVLLACWLMNISPVKCLQKNSLIPALITTTLSKNVLVTTKHIKLLL
jgi:hypothetical protein